MKKFKVGFSWYASMRGYDEVEVEADSPEEAQKVYWEKVNIDYNEHTKIINSEREIDIVEELGAAE